jgi:hypothetical protein
MLGLFHLSLAAEVDTKMATLRKTWKGQSATAAEAYFDRLVDALDDMEPALKSISSDYHKVAYGMYSEAQALLSIISTIEALAFAIAASLAVTGAVSWTGVGLLVGLGTTGAEIACLGAALWEAYGILSKMMAWINGFVGVTAGFLGAREAIDTLDKVSQSSTAYDSPFVS